MLLSVFAATLGAAFLVDKGDTETFGYGESTLGRIPTSLWERGGFGLRGEPRNWRDSEPRFGGSGFPVSGGLLGMRGPTSSFRYPMPRPWERAPVGWKNAIPVRMNRYGEEASQTRIDPDDYDLTYEKAAAAFAKFAQGQGRALVLSPEGKPLYRTGYAEVMVELTGGPLSEREVNYLKYSRDRFGIKGVRHRLEQSPIDPTTLKPYGPNTRQVFFSN